MMAQREALALPLTARTGEEMKLDAFEVSYLFARAVKAMAAYDALPKGATPKTRREAVDQIRSAPEQTRRLVRLGQFQPTEACGVRWRGDHEGERQVCGGGASPSARSLS